LLLHIEVWGEGEVKTAPSLLEFQFQVTQLAQVNQEDRIHPGKQSTIA